jgi:hypothetical protein
MTHLTKCLSRASVSHPTQNMTCLTTSKPARHVGSWSPTRSESEQSDMCIVDMPSLEDCLRTKLAIHDSSLDVRPQAQVSVVCSDWTRPTKTSNKPPKPDILNSKPLSFLCRYSTRVASEQDTTTRSTSSSTREEITTDAEQLTTYICSIDTHDCSAYQTPNLDVTSATGEAAVPSAFVHSACTSIDGSSSWHDCFLDRVRESTHGEDVSSSLHSRLPKWLRGAQTAVQASISSIVQRGQVAE